MIGIGLRAVVVSRGAGVSVDLVSRRPGQMSRHERAALHVMAADEVRSPLMIANLIELLSPLVPVVCLCCNEAHDMREVVARIRKTAVLS